MKKKQSKATIFILLFSLIVFVIATSTLSNTLWGGKPEKIEADLEIVFSQEMTVKAFGEKNNLSKEVLKKVFALTGKKDLEKLLSEFTMDEAMVSEKINKTMALHAEEGSKNWVKILVKFLSWFLFLYIMFRFTRAKKVTPGKRKILYLISLTIFGVILGSDPSAMGTIKDAIVLYATKGVIFPPRMIALTVFLLLVFFANKFFCAWGCQVGTFQDLIFRLNRNKKDTKGLFRQYKPCFALTNTIRIAFFAVFTTTAFVWSIDIIEKIDMFKIYKISALSHAGWLFIAVVLMVSLFIYRPWCSLFCPFGLAGWFVEKLSLFKIKVNYNKCTSCGICAKACPNTSMSAILKQDKTIPDCFSCSTCINVCPEDAIEFAKGKRQKPEPGKFDKLV